MDIDILDIQLKFLNGKPIEIDNILIYPITLDQISDIGYNEYQRLLSLLCMGTEQLKSIEDLEIEDEDIYYYLVQCACYYPSIMELFIEAFELICRCEVKFDENKLIFITDTGEINNDNFLKIQSILKKRNGLENIEEDIDNPENSKARSLLIKRKKNREKLRNAKMSENNDTDTQITLNDLISILASGLQMSLFEVFKYDMYQFNDQFNRLRIFDDYNVNVQAILHGANSKQIKLKHWITSIKENNNY